MTTPDVATLGADEPLVELERAPNARLRVSLNTYKGSRFCHVRLWLRGREGTWRPHARAGLTVRTAELRAVAAAMLEAAARLEGEAV